MKRLSRAAVLSAVISVSVLSVHLTMAADKDAQAPVKTPVKVTNVVNTKVVTNPLRQPTSSEKALQDLERLKKTNNDLAIQHFSNVLKKNAKDATAYSRRGKAFSGNREYDKALADFNKAIELDQKQTEAFVGRAVVYLLKKDYDKCWKDVHQAEALGGQFWPSFKEALEKGSGRKK